MQIENIDFVLNDSVKLVIELKEPLETFYYCDEASIFFVKDGERCLLSENALHENMYVLRNLLGKALENQLHLHSSIKKDIGYLFNEELMDKPGLIYEEIEGHDFWVGDHYLLWDSKLATWLYNGSANDLIILHITPVYPGVFGEEENLVSYEKWIAGYLSLCTMTIPKSIAYQWWQQADKIVRQIEQNGRMETANECANES